MHVHVHSSRGEAKFWLEPQIEWARSFGLSSKDLRTIRRLIEENEDEIRTAWQRHFGA